MARIGSIAELTELFGKLAKAFLAKQKLEATCKDKKRKADEEYKTAVAQHETVLNEHEEAALSYVDDHREEIFDKGKKSAVLGAVTVQAKLASKPVLRTLRGDEPEPKSILEAIEEWMTRTQSADRLALLEGCIDREPKLKLDEVKKLPEKMLADINLQLVQNETISWKPNGDR